MQIRNREPILQPQCKSTIKQALPRRVRCQRRRDHTGQHLAWGPLSKVEWVSWTTEDTRRSGRPKHPLP